MYPVRYWYFLFWKLDIFSGGFSWSFNFSWKAKKKYIDYMQLKSKLRFFQVEFLLFSLSVDGSKSRFRTWPGSRFGWDSPDSMNTVPDRTLIILVEFFYSHAILLQVCRLPVEHLCGQAVSCISKRQKSNHSLWYIFTSTFADFYLKNLLPDIRERGTTFFPFFPN